MIWTRKQIFIPKFWWGIPSRSMLGMEGMEVLFSWCEKNRRFCWDLSNKNDDFNGICIYIYIVVKTMINHPFGNGNHTTYKNGTDWGMDDYCFTHISVNLRSHQKKLLSSSDPHQLTFYLTYILEFYLAYILAHILAYILAFILAYILAFNLAYILAFYLAFSLTYILTCTLIFVMVFCLTFYLTFCLAFCLAFYLMFFLALELKFKLTCIIIWHSIVHSIRHIFWHSVWYIWHVFWHSLWYSICMLSGMQSDVCSAILYGIYADTTSDILSDTYVDILFISTWHIFWHSVWHSIWHSIWHIFWHSVWHFLYLFGSVRAQLNPELVTRFRSMRAKSEPDFAIRVRARACPDWSGVCGKREASGARVLELAFAVTSRPVGHNDDRLAEGEGRGKGVRAGGWVGVAPLLKSRDSHQAGEIRSPKFFRLIKHPNSQI